MEEPRGCLRRRSQDNGTGRVNWDARQPTGDHVSIPTSRPSTVVASQDRHARIAFTIGDTISGQGRLPGVRRVATAMTRPLRSFHGKIRIRPDKTKGGCVKGRRTASGRFGRVRFGEAGSTRGPDRVCARRASPSDRSGSARRDERPSRRSDRVRPVAGRDGRRMVRRGAVLAGPTPRQSTRSRPSRGRGLHGRDVAAGSEPAAAPRHRCVGRLAVRRCRVLRRLRVPGGSHRESRRMGAARRDGARTTGVVRPRAPLLADCLMAIFRRPPATLRVPRTAS